MGDAVEALEGVLGEEVAPGLSTGAITTATADESDVPTAVAADAYAIEGFEVDSNSTDTDSGVEGMSILSSTDSLNSSMYEHVISNGRTYHKYKHGKYLLPNDESEQNRLDLQHHLALLTLHGELHLAPIKPNLHHALDIGTGTGIWAIDFAIKYPSCHVLGCDLSPIQPLYVPPNCHFEVDDAEDEWQYSHKFDYIHGRFLASCFKDARGVFQKAFDALAPGGYFEMLDTRVLTCIDSSADGSQLMHWVDLMLEAATVLGRDFDKVRKYKGWMEDIGFIGIREAYFAWPTNTWPRGRHHKTLGLWAGHDLKDGIEGFSMAALTRGLGWSPDDIRSLLGDVRVDMDDRNIHCYIPILAIYGRKPL